MYRNIVYRIEDDDNPAGFACSYCLYKLHFIHSINVRPSPSAGLSLFILLLLSPFLTACPSLFRCHQTTPTTTAIPIPFFRHPSPSPSWGSAGGELCVGISQKPAPGLLLLLLLLQLRLCFSLFCCARYHALCMLLHVGYIKGLNNKIINLFVQLLFIVYHSNSLPYFPLIFLQGNFYLCVFIGYLCKAEAYEIHLTSYGI